MVKANSIIKLIKIRSIVLSIDENLNTPVIKRMIDCRHPLHNDVIRITSAADFVMLPN